MDTKASSIPAASSLCPLVRILRQIAGAKPDTVCIGGYAGCGNLGDDAILQGTLASIFSQKSPAYAPNITVLSGSPRRDSRRFGVRCVHRKNPFAILAAFLRSERFLCGGGSLLQNATGTRSLLYYLFLLRLAHACGCRVEIFAAGIGPLHGSFAQKQTLAVLNLCREISLRDPDSYRLLTSMGVKRELLKRRPDPALFLPIPPPSRRAFLLREAEIPAGKHYFCVVLRAPDPEFPTLPQTLTAAIRLFSRKHDLLPIFLTFDPSSDGRLTEKVCRQANGKKLRLREASDAPALFSGADFLIGMRLHALIFSVIAHLPAIGISASEAEPKLRTFCRSAAIAHFYPDELNVVKFVEELEHLYANRERLRKALPSIAEELRAVPDNQ